MLLAALLSTTMFALPQSPAPSPAPQAAAPVTINTPADCIKAGRDFLSRRQKEMAPLTQEKFTQITAEKNAMQKDCAAKFDATTTIAVELAELYADMGNVDASATLVAAVKKDPKATKTDIAKAIALEVTNGMRETKSDARNARLEKLVDELDALGPAAFEQQFSVHSRMNGYYRGDDIDAGIIKHSTWIIKAGETCPPEDRVKLGMTVASAHVNMAQAWAGQGMTDKAIALLNDGAKKWGDISPRPGTTALDTYFTPEIERLALVGTPAAALKAPVWFNGPATKELALPGHVTLLEFTAHWCGPCRESYPGVNRLRAKYGAQGFQVVLATQLYGYFEAERNLTPEAEIAKDKTYFEHHELGNVPVAIGNKVDVKVVNGKVEYLPAKDPNDVHYRVGGIPQIHLIDKKGNIRLIMVGYDDANEANLAKMIETLLKEK
jgi:thiol-disulfide isomerase/thioredoxin